MSQTSEKSKRIAKNTIALYFRTLITMAIGLFTSRVVLNVLGINDYGTYNVVGGVVAMFSVLTSSMSQAVSRYLTFELGKGNRSRLQTIFSTSVNIQMLMSAVVLILMETVGVWFLNSKMNISSDRMFAANWVFQFSIFTFIINLISVPYNAAIIAHERMSAFAYVSILEAVLKLIVVVGLLISSIDKLITYSFMQLCVSIIIRMIYGHYCSKHFTECKYAFVIDKSLLKDMTNFAGWNAISVIAWVFNTQGINILLNLFFGVAINAAKGIATQVEGIIKNFVQNFTTAVKPQIIKSYSSGDTLYLYKLIFTSTKYSYYLMMIFALPIMFEAETILKIWLGNYPPYAPIFLRLTMIVTLVAILGDLLYTNILAIGKLRTYMIQETCITILIFPLSYMLLKVKFPPEIPYILTILAYSILTLVRLAFLKKKEGFSCRYYFTKVIWPVLLVTFSTIILPYIVKELFYEKNSIISSLLIMALCEFCLLISIYLLGLDKQERLLVYSIINKRLKKKNRK